MSCPHSMLQVFSALQPSVEFDGHPLGPAPHAETAQSPAEFQHPLK